MERRVKTEQSDPLPECVSIIQFHSTFDQKQKGFEPIIKISSLGGKWLAQKENSFVDRFQIAGFSNACHHYFTLLLYCIPTCRYNIHYYKAVACLIVTQNNN